ncbi:hypothetical protein D3C77_409630 [compost metagenome]
MRVAPQPLFETFECFHQLNFLGLQLERSVILGYLKRLTFECSATDSYLVVRSFLKSYAGNKATLNIYSGDCLLNVSSSS